MKKLALLTLVVALFANCGKTKLTDKPYLKVTVGGTNYEYNENQIEAGIIKAADQVDNRDVFYVRSIGTSLGSNPVFFVQSRTNLTLNQNNPIMAVMPGDEVGMILNSKTYQLKNGTLNPEKTDLVVGIGGYMKGVFSVTLTNKANSSEEVQVSGSYFHNNY